MITNKLFNMAITGLVILSSSLAGAQSEPCYATTVIDYVAGTQNSPAEPLDAERMHSEYALGMPENNNTMNFVSLGYGGSITLGFSGMIYDMPGNDISIIETSFASNNCLSDGIEKASVYLSMNGVDFEYAGEVCRNGAVDISETTFEYVTAIRIVNHEDSTTFDGYDVDGVIAINGCTSMEGCYAFQIVDVEQGTRSNGQPITDPIRIDPNRALGTPQNNRSNGAANFFSLGKDGYIVLRMGGGIITDGTSAPDLRVYETTWGNPSCEDYTEYAEVSVSHDGIFWYSLGTHCQSSNISLDIDGAIPGGLRVSYVRIENDGSLGNTNDYFDVDGVESLWGCDVVPDTDRGDCFATTLSGLGYVQGTKKNGSAINPNRTNAQNALGQPQMDDTINFVTLGYGGSLQLSFNGSVFNEEGDDLQVIETSFGSPSCENYTEKVDVEVSIDGTTWYSVGTGCMDFTIDLSDAPIYLPFINHVRLINSAESMTEDAFDVDGIIFLHSNENCTDDVDTTEGGSIQRLSTEMTAYPNPSAGNLNFSFTSYTPGKATLELYNVKGQLVSTVFNGETVVGEENVVDFDGSSLPNGLYISRLHTADGTITGKVVITH
ncbi:MAG TPA: T9SS type A sorting domain-containing protein [Flavobacterium sp.]|jgi:hypothetical protein